MLAAAFLRIRPRGSSGWPGAGRWWRTRLLDALRENFGAPPRLWIELRENFGGPPRLPDAASAARIRKNEAKDSYDVIFLRSARILEDFCRYAGLNALADRVRPSTSRPGRTEVEPDEVPDEVLARIGDLPAASGQPAEESNVDSTTTT